jgi:hypothetical protein
MRDILPSDLLEILREKYLAGVADAEAAFDQHFADEDSLTGGLGQAIAMRKPILFNDPSGTYAVTIQYQKLRGRGPGAPEKQFGSDGIFQISVTDSNGNIIRRKGLPFQAKTNWRGKNKALYDQAIQMEENTPGGLVIDYSPTGYKACRAKTIIDSNGSREIADRDGAMRPLGQVLSRDFLECTIGTVGLYYDPEREIYVSPSDIDVITTKIIKVGRDAV